MVPDRFLTFISENNLGLHIATRNKDLIPAVGKAFSVRVSKDKKRVEFTMSEKGAKIHLENLENNGEIALNIGAIPSHETYQFKGSFIKYRNCAAEDVPNIKNGISRFKAGVILFGLPEDVANKLDMIDVNNCVAIELEVKEIFEQTPKPGTGNKIES